MIDGYNGTVFAYGQTGSGKTFTMMGADIESPELRGVIPRIVEQIFESIIASPSTMEYTVKVSYMEIYMERIRDLLQPQNDNLPIHEEKNRGVYVKGLLEVYVSSIPEVMEVMRRGGNSRAVAYTNMNAESSRSHSIFVITVNQKNLENGSARSGRLFLVDLAGSEKVGKTGASGQTLEEAKKINKSLSALGMVINSLTDGKSSHIPYRDSKLTRILQESLGGNSRTTLIINCSPSSYNDAETVSTLRFGTRAKSIKNKAKVNAELSPAELKALLKRAKAEALTFNQYISALETEVNIWRTGGAVPKEQWANAEKAAQMAAAAGGAPVSAPDKAALVHPGLESVKEMEISRPATPTLQLERDEREEFLKRENELTDQLAERESALAAQEKALKEIREELVFYKEQENAMTTDNKSMASELNDLRLQLEKVTYENKEGNITMDSLREANQELSAELEEVKKSLTEIKITQKDAAAEDKEKKKAEKMAQMMAGFDQGGISEKEKQIRTTLSKLDAALDGQDGVKQLSSSDIVLLKHQLSESQAVTATQERSINDIRAENLSLLKKKEELEGRLSSLELEYEELLDKTIADEEANSNSDLTETIAELRNKLETQYAAKRDAQVKEISDLKQELDRKASDAAQLSASLQQMKKANDELQTAATAGGTVSNGSMAEREKDMERIRKTMAQQLADFDVMKKSLMRDLQNRCEKVVELEISLDETREQYNNVLRNSNNKAQQKKMAFLERNLEQLTNVQKQLVEQNSSLKKEVAIAERKLIARNERIQSLEALLQDAQEKLTTQNQKFEAQLQAVRERLEQARSQKNAAGGLSFGRIAKPLRGGGAPVSSPEAGVTGEGGVGTPNSKRTSWFFGKQA